jgi:hypothetical protein
MRLGVDEAGVTELVAVVEHTRCLVVVAGALLMERLGDEPGLVAAVDPAAAPEPVRAVLAEIATALAPTMPVPGLWRALARTAHHLEATWRKEQVVMAAGALTPLDKRRVALAIAMNGRSRYMIEYESALLRAAGDDDEAVLEILGVVDHYNALNTLSDAMQIDSDIRPPLTGARSTPEPIAAPPPVAAAAPPSSLPAAPVEVTARPSVFTAPKPRPAAPQSGPTPSGVLSPETSTDVEAAERRLRAALAAEAAMESEQRAKIKKGAFGCAGLLVLLFILAVLFL